ESLLLVCSLIPAAHGRSERLEEWCAAIGEFKCAPVLLRPRLFNPHLVDRLLVATLAEHRNCEPLYARAGFDPVAIVPMTFHVLHPVEYHIFVASPDQVKKASPRHVARLNNRYPHGFHPSSEGLTSA